MRSATSPLSRTISSPRWKCVRSGGATASRIRSCHPPFIPAYSPAKPKRLRFGETGSGNPGECLRGCEVRVPLSRGRTELLDRLVAEQFRNGGRLLALLRYRGSKFVGVSWTDDLPGRRQSFHDFGVGRRGANVVGYLGADLVGYSGRSEQSTQPVKFERRIARFNRSAPTAQRRCALAICDREHFDGSSFHLRTHDR